MHTTLFSIPLLRVLALILLLSLSTKGECPEWWTDLTAEIDAEEDMTIDVTCGDGSAYLYVKIGGGACPENINITWELSGASAGVEMIYETDPSSSSRGIYLNVNKEEAKSGTLTVKVTVTATEMYPDCPDLSEAKDSVEIEIIADDGCDSCDGGGGGGSGGGGSGGGGSGGGGSGGGGSGGGGSGGGGSGGGGSGGGSHSHSGGNGTSPAQGSSSANNSNGPNLNFSLGEHDDSGDAGVIRLSGETASSALVSPSSLEVPFSRANVSVYPATGSLEQVKSPQGLARVVDTSSTDSQYDLEFYYHNDVSFNGTKYVPNQNASPYVVYNIKQPSGNVNQLEITETRGSTVVQVLTYTYSPTTGKWTMTDGAGIRSIVSWETVSAPYTHKYYEVWAGSQLVHKTHRTYKTIEGFLFLTQLEEGSGGITRVTNYTPYETIDGMYGVGREKRIDYPDGRWEMFEYDAFGRVTTRWESYLDLAPPTGGNFPDAYTSRRTTYYYSPIDTENDDGTARQMQPRMVSTYIPAPGGGEVEISRAFWSVKSFYEVEEQRCPNPETGYFGDPENVVSVTVYYSGSSDLRRGKLKYIVYPNKTASLFDYLSSVGGTVEIERTGEPNSTFTSILNGTYSETIRNELGRVRTNLVKLISNGQAPSTILARTITTYSGDQLVRDRQVTDLAGRTTSYYYACCGLESVTDADGLSTVYDYDAIKRRVAQTQMYSGSGIKWTNILDASGRVLVRKRIGTDGSSALTLDQYQYDVLGRLLKHTNALSGVTSYSETIVSSKRQVASTFPDSGTKTEVYHRDGRLEKITGTATFGVKYVYSAEQDGTSGPWRECVEEIKLDGSGNNTNERTKTYYDGIGRAYKVVYNAASTPLPYEERFYNAKNQLAKTRDPDNVIHIYEYDAEGRRVRSAVDLNQNGLADRDDAGTSEDDRITDTIQDVLASGVSGNIRGTDIFRTRTFVYSANNSVATNLVLTVERATDGLRTWTVRQKDTSTKVTEVDQTVYGTGGSRTRTVTKADGSAVETVYSKGRASTAKTKNSSGAQVALTTYGYDIHGRVSSSTDARNGATYFTYNAADAVQSTTSPAPGTGEGPQVTTTFYDNLGRVTGELLPDASSRTNFYFTIGLLHKSYGSRNYPVEYTYDPQGRMKTMKTWRNFAASSETAITTWNYHSYRGWLVSKYYPNASTGAPGTSGVIYEYKGSGRLWKRTWERGVLTTYAYNNGGDLQSIAYSGGSVSTPGTTFTYDRRGRRATAARNSITTTFSYNEANQLLGEAYSGGGTLGGLSANFEFDNYLRESAVEIKNGGTSLQRASYAYDTDGRLETVTDSSASTYTTKYAYHPNSRLVNTITFTNTGSGGMVTTQTYDKLNRLQSISSKAYGSSAPNLPVSTTYVYNSANQRQQSYAADGSYWVYEYDALGQVTSGRRYWADGTQVAGQQFVYNVDDIGNRKTTSGRTSAVSTYTRDYQNKYTERTVAGSVDVTGVANPTASVTVNGTAAARKGDYFHRSLPVSNSGGAQYPSVTVTSHYGSTESNPSNEEAFVPQTPEAFGHDADGNLTSDGRWAYEWDGENRLSVMRSKVGSSAPERRIEFEYDYFSRRIRQTVWNDRDDGQGSELSDAIYLYDRWNLAGELDANNSKAKVRTYIRGLDLSTSRHGAGGVGGLLKVVDYIGGTTHHFVCYDGNGNVLSLSMGTTGAATARYDYGPFGESIRATGGMAKKNPFRFSTKATDNESGLLYYGYRYYNPLTGRWLNRDPITERGGIALFTLTRNDPVSRYDLLGLRDPDDPQPGPGIEATSFQMCQRDILGSDIITKCVNGIGGEHTYIDVMHPAPEVGPPHHEGIGFSQGGVSAEAAFGGTCRPCNKARHGVLPSGQSVQSASHYEIWSCIQNHAPRRGYNCILYNCHDWAGEAAAACGLDCD